MPSDLDQLFAHFPGRSLIVHVSEPPEYHRGEWAESEDPRVKLQPEYSGWEAQNAWVRNARYEAQCLMEQRLLLCLRRAQYPRDKRGLPPTLYDTCLPAVAQVADCVFYRVEPGVVFVLKDRGDSRVSDAYLSAFMRSWLTGERCELPPRDSYVGTIQHYRHS